MCSCFVFSKWALSICVNWNKDESGKFCRDRPKNVVPYSVEEIPSLVRGGIWSCTESMSSFLYHISALVTWAVSCRSWSGNYAIPLTPIGLASAVHHRGAAIVGHHGVSATDQQSKMCFTGGRPQYAVFLQSVLVQFIKTLKYWRKERQVYNYPIFDIRYYQNVQLKQPTNSISSLYIWKCASCYCQVLSQIDDYGVQAYLSIQSE